MAQSCHEMSKRAYRSDLREALAEDTRVRIVEAAYRLLKTTRPVDLSYADVAEAAGVSLRTVYRAFPTPDDLFVAVSDRLFETIGAPDPVETDLDAMIALLRREFETLDADPALFRVIFAVPTRSRWNPRALYDRLFAPYLEALSERDRVAAYALIDLLSCPYAWDVMHHNWKVPADRAVRAILVALRALFDHLKRTPEALSLDHPEPTFTPRRKS